jgi:NADH dehydrogenase
MHILVTGGTGVVGQATLRALVACGHRVRLLSRHARRDAKAWPDSVEPMEGDVADAASLRGAADGCDAVLHLVGIVRESDPDLTFERVNVQGTRNVLAEAVHAGVPRFVYVSSLGADRGASEYHRSKLAGEELTRSFPHSWTIVRPGNVYGPGDEVVSLLLKMVRTLPAVPVIASGDQPFQPVWAGDVAEALARVVERDDLAGEVLDVSGPDRTSSNDLIERFERLTGRSPVRVPIPGFLAKFGARAAEMLHLELPLSESQLVMLGEENVIDEARGNALERVLGIRPTPLDEGLRRLADALPESLPSDGVGGLERKRFWADIESCTLTDEQLFARLREDFDRITPWQLDVGNEPGTPTELAEGRTITMGLPLRGTVQVRVEELTPTRLTLATLEGHPLAGAVRFLTQRLSGDRVRFEVQTYTRAANAVDWVVMSLVGGGVQNATWRAIVETMEKESGGRATNGVQEEKSTLSEDAAGKVEAWLERLISDRRREEVEELTHDAPNDQPQAAASSATQRSP